MSIRIQSLRTFVAVAETGNLADAAERLHRTPSAVSMTLKRLEEHFGRPLFEADRKSRLTALGHFVLLHARRELEHFAHTVRVMERHARGDAGSLRVACVPSVATRLMPEVLRRFRERHAGVEIEVRDQDSASVHEALRQSRVDVGIASPAPADRFATRPLLRDPFGIVCAPDHPLARRRGALRFAALAGHDFIANGTCRGIADADLQRCIENCTLTVFNTTSLVALVAAGVGVTVLPRLALPVEPVAVVFRALARPVPHRQLVLLTRGDVAATPAAEEFVRLLGEVAAGID